MTLKKDFSFKVMQYLLSTDEVLRFRIFMYF